MCLAIHYVFIVFFHSIMMASVSVVVISRPMLSF